MNCTGEELYCTCLLIVLHAEFVKCKEVDGIAIIIFNSKTSLLPSKHILMFSLIWASSDRAAMKASCLYSCELLCSIFCKIKIMFCFVVDNVAYDIVSNNNNVSYYCGGKPRVNDDDPQGKLKCAKFKGQSS